MCCPKIITCTCVLNVQSDSVQHLEAGTCHLMKQQNYADYEKLVSTSKDMPAKESVESTLFMSQPNNVCNLLSLLFWETTGLSAIKHQINIQQQSFNAHSMMFNSILETHLSKHVQDTNIV